MAESIIHPFDKQLDVCHSIWLSSCFYWIVQWVELLCIHCHDGRGVCGQLFIAADLFLVGESERSGGIHFFPFGKIVSFFLFHFILQPLILLLLLFLFHFFNSFLHCITDVLVQLEVSLCREFASRSRVRIACNLLGSQFDHLQFRKGICRNYHRCRVLITSPWR